MLHECSHCHEKVITAWSKATAGSLASKGTKCPKCGAYSVNDVSSSYFRSVMTAIVLIYTCLVFYKNIGGYYFKFGSVLGVVILSRLLIIGFDAVFPKLTNSVYKRR